MTMAEENETPQAQGSPEQPSPAEGNASSEKLEASKEARDMAMLLHLFGIMGFFAPLVIWLNEKDKHKFVYEHGKSAMNYHISIIIYYIASWLLCLIFVGIFMLAALIVMHIVFVIMGTVKASKGQMWKYPIAIRFLK